MDQRRGPIVHPKKMTPSEEAVILSTLNGERFCDSTPHWVVAKLADEGQYLCSVSQMYRVLRKNLLLKHRGQWKRPEYNAKVETAATAPNQVWSWDITFLQSQIRGESYKLYMLEDIFSRKIVGYTLSLRECDKIAAQLIESSLLSEMISGYNLRLHNDNGNPMRAYTFVERIKALGIIQSFSRPRVKNDNPFSESLFRTMKYHLSYPLRPFASMDAAKVWVDEFVHWYNHEHLHSGINYVTPHDRHEGNDLEILKNRSKVFKQAQDQKPHRWSGKAKVWTAQTVVELNSEGCRIRK